MKMIGAEKDNKLSVGCLTDIANLIGTYPNKIYRWISEGDRTVLINGYKLFLETKIIKSKRKRK